MFKPKQNEKWDDGRSNSPTTIKKSNFYHTMYGFFAIEEENNQTYLKSRYPTREPFGRPHLFSTHYISIYLSTILIGH